MKFIFLFLNNATRDPLEHTPSVHQLSENLDRVQPIEGEAPSRRGCIKSRRSKSFCGLLDGYPGISQGTRSRVGEAEDEEGEESVEEEGSEETEVAAGLAGAPESSEALNLALSNQCLVSQAEPNFLKIMEKMTQLIGQLTQEVSPKENSRALAFKTLSMNAPDYFHGDMDLPPLSFHASLEEQWGDGEDPEEIESVIKIVPLLYNHFLHALFKLKAEKLPPHHAFDNDIKMEGLLPPIGAIHSLSNHESETLWAYISSDQASLPPESLSYSPIIFNEEALSQFELLREEFTTAPIFSHFNPSLTTIVEKDASDYALGALLSQVNDSERHAIALDRHKLFPSELKYEVHDKEVLGIVWALQG
ncbi:hypothetical protein O181_014413 [Austropuccinia psidii MF-1]|uniref:Reverse transcriptase/retrotransposon-derived protein RNase H-like domain-containing protein n=1 Tax=Austropuccinia psidii MF-1 TaxID=1389203 RepID=A0A9Q3GP09_9BASI|nr:hypothetical protein [Austropuccinia psidii MF-1]